MEYRFLYLAGEVYITRLQDCKVVTVYKRLNMEYKGFIEDV